MSIDTSKVATTNTTAATTSGPSKAGALAGWADDRLGLATLAKKNLRKVFPDHWSFMLGEIALAGRSPYASSKGGLTLLTKTLALEWARDGINVNALCPGPFATEINTPLLNDPVARAQMEANVPLGRWGDPIELGPAAVFLASPASRHVTGETLLVDAGTHLGFASLSMR